MRIIRIVARGGEFYFNFNISIETIQIFESFRSEREKSRKFRRKFETLPSNTDLNNAHTREKIGTWWSRDSITIKYHDTFIQILRIKSIYLVPYRAVFFFFFFFFEVGRALITPSKVFISIPVQVALNCALNEITFFPRKSGIGTREVDEKKRLDYG